MVFTAIYMDFQLYGGLKVNINPKGLKLLFNFSAIHTVNGEQNSSGANETFQFTFPAGLVLI